jgi:hypothetical protein
VYLSSYREPYSSILKEGLAMEEIRIKNGMPISIDGKKFELAVIEWNEHRRPFMLKLIVNPISNTGNDGHKFSKTEYAYLRVGDVEQRVLVELMQVEKFNTGNAELTRLVLRIDWLGSTPMKRKGLVQKPFDAVHKRYDAGNLNKMIKAQKSWEPLHKCSLCQRPHDGKCACGSRVCIDCKKSHVVTVHGTDDSIPAYHPNRCKCPECYFETQKRINEAHDAILDLKVIPQITKLEGTIDYSKLVIKNTETLLFGLTVHSVCPKCKHIGIRNLGHDGINREQFGVYQTIRLNCVREECNKVWSVDIQLSVDVKVEVRNHVMVPRLISSTTPDEYVDEEIIYDDDEDYYGE